MTAPSLAKEGSPAEPAPGFATPYSMRQFARLAGLSTSTVARRVRDGTIRFVRVGRLVRIPASEIGRLFG